MIEHTHSHTDKQRDQKKEETSKKERKKEKGGLGIWASTKKTNNAMVLVYSIYTVVVVHSQYSRNQGEKRIVKRMDMDTHTHAHAHN